MVPFTWWHFQSTIQLVRMERRRSSRRTQRTRAARSSGLGGVRVGMEWRVPLWMKRSWSGGKVLWYLGRAEVGASLRVSEATEEQALGMCRQKLDYTVWEGNSVLQLGSHENREEGLCPEVSNSSQGSAWAVGVLQATAD